MRPTIILSLPSVCTLYSESLQSAASLLLDDGGSRRYLRESFPRCLDPYPGGSPGAYARCFPEDIGLRRVGTGSARHSIRTATSIRG